MFQSLEMIKQCYHQVLLYVVVKKSRFIDEQQASGLLSSLNIKTSFRKILLLGNILF